jgi:transcriptional regulator with XRE-family HTH domain
MISLISTSKAQQIIATNLQTLRVQRGLTQEGLAKRSGVSLATLRKFEQKGALSLESFLKISMVLGNLDRLIEATKPAEENFSSIEDVLKGNNSENRKRGWRK